MASITSVALGIGLCVAAGAGVVTSATPAGADPPIACSTGVVVAVDFSPWSSTLNSVCDSTLPANGVSALQSAGFALTGVTGYGLQFICQIDDDPPGESLRHHAAGERLLVVVVRRGRADRLDLQPARGRGARTPGRQHRSVGVRRSQR